MMPIELYRTMESGTRSAWCHELGAENGRMASLHWTATLVIDINEKVFRRLIRVAAANRSKEAQRGPFRLRLKDYTEREAL